MREGVTIVATVFNKAYCLPLVISAIARQQWRGPIEVIFVDDGSTDDSLEVISRAMGQLGSVLVVSQANSGPSRALNVGLACVQTAYVKGLDGDDILTPHATASLLSALQSSPGCHWAYGRNEEYAAFPPDLDSLFARLKPENTGAPVDDQLRKSIRQPHTNPSAWIAETAFLRKIKGCDDEVFIQDYSLELRMAAESPVVFIPETVFFSHAEITERRMMNNGRQVLHDCNLAVRDLFVERPNLLANYGWDAAKRLSGRAWHWARRHEGRTLLSREYRDFVASRLRIGNPLSIMTRSCGSFVKGVRRPERHKGPQVMTARGAFERDFKVGAIVSDSAL